MFHDRDAALRGWNNFAIFVRFQKPRRSRQSGTPTATALARLRRAARQLAVAHHFCEQPVFWIAFIARVSIAPYFFEYNLHRKDLIGLANSRDFQAQRLVDRAARPGHWATHHFFGVQNNLSLAWIITGWAFGFLASGMAMAMPFSVLADSVDFGEWKTGVRAAGLLTAIGAAFCPKAGSGLGGALPAWIMSANGYVANQTQTPQSLKGIEIGFIWLPALFLR
jgi:Na+/melibiose symporter-like transporter